VSAFAARAELLEDRGEAAVSSEFFRSREFLDAEGATHTLRIEGESVTLVAPLVVREIGGGPERDGVSPYSFPGVVERDGSPAAVAIQPSGDSGLALIAFWPIRNASSSIA